MDEKDQHKQTEYLNPIAEPEHVEIGDPFMEEVKWRDVDISANWLDPKEQYIRPRYTLSYNGTPFAPLGGIHGLTGQPGHGKTFTFTQLMVAILRGDFYGLHYELSSSIPNPSVLYIDTEMEKGNTQLVMLRVYEMMGWDHGSQHDEFRILWLREELKSLDRWRKVLRAIYDMRPTVVFLDGLIDVLADFNDNKECQDLIYQCMKTASYYKISMWLLLHENPGSEKMVGHAGSFLERKATDVLKTKKEKGATILFNVEQKKARGRDLDKWQFVIDDDEHHYGHPRILLDSDNNTDTQPTEDEVKRMISPIGTSKDVSMTTLREKMKRAHGIGSTKAKEYIDLACRMNLLTVRDNRFTPNPEDLFKDDNNELPF